MAKIKANKPQLGIGGKLKLKRPEKGEIAPVFDSLFGAHPAEATPNPLSEMEYTGDAEVDAQAEIDHYRSALYRAEQEKRDLFRTLLLDTEYYICICFQSRTQKEEFLEKIGWFDLGDKYLDGLKVAERLGIDIEPVNLPKPPPPKTPKPLRNVQIIRKGGDD
jgi:hypothetical protein